jgi:phosphohistidine phosphatase
MEIYLVRHAEAVERAEELEEGTRWLTKKGRKAIHKGALRLRKKRVRPDLIITSPLTRAVQTAELLMAEVGSHAELVADSRVAPDGTAEQLVELIRGSKQGDRLMLVGHEPLLSQTAALLLGKELAAGFAKGSCLALELRAKPGKPAQFLWYAATAGKVISTAKKALVSVA